MRRLTIVQGEHAVCSEPGLSIQTVLGSCISVCLVDPVRRVGGMNHFLLGQPQAGTRHADLSRYGVHAMELLVNAMMRLGCERQKLRAHLYGGATMIEGLGDIGHHNILFARQFCRTEGIEIRHEDTGGRQARRVEFLPYEGRSRCRFVCEPVTPPLPTPTVNALARSGELELF
jgi:chemotaxis protein CheD